MFAFRTTSLTIDLWRKAIYYLAQTQFPKTIQLVQAFTPDPNLLSLDSMNIKQQIKSDRPREKMLQKGAAALTDQELLMAMLGSGIKGANVADLSRKILKLVRSKGPDLQLVDIRSIRGIGDAKAVTIFSALEFAKRQLTINSQALNSPDKVLNLLFDISTKKQEYFILLTIDGANRLIKKRTITIGTLTASLVHPREVFAPAIEDRAASVIVAHNHPSGNLEPSQADLHVTKRLKHTGELLGIPLVDHIIIAGLQWLSIV